MLLRMLVLSTFALSFAHKVLAIGEFAATVDKLTRLPRRVRTLVVLAVVAAELAVVVALFVGRPLATWGLPLAVGLLAAFTGVIGCALRSGYTVHCNCFGRSPYTMTYFDLARNLVLGGGALAAALLADHAAYSPRLDEFATAAPLACATLLALALALLAVLLHLVEIVALLLPTRRPPRTPAVTS